MSIRETIGDDAFFGMRYNKSPRSSEIAQKNAETLQSRALTAGVYESYMRYDTAQLAAQQDVYEKAKEYMKSDTLENPFEAFTRDWTLDMRSSRLLNTDSEFFSERAYQAAAQKDPGGIIGRSLRSTGAQFAGSREVINAMPKDIQDHAAGFLDALELATGSTGNIDSWGWGVEGHGTGLGKLFDGVYDYAIGGTGHMRGMAIGTPLYEAVHKEDPNWTPKLRETFANALFNEQTEELYKAAGLSREDLLGTRSLGHAMAIITDKQASQMLNLKKLLQKK